MNFKETERHYRDLLKEGRGVLMPDIERAAVEFLNIYRETTAETLLQELAEQTECTQGLTPATVFIKRKNLWYKFDLSGNVLVMDSEPFKSVNYNLRPKCENAAYVISSVKWNFQGDDKKITSNQICLQLRCEDKSIQLDIFAGKLVDSNFFCNISTCRHNSLSCLDSEGLQTAQESLGTFIVKAGVDAGLTF